MGRQWNTIIESLGPLSGGTGLSINANLTEIEALLTTLQADIVDGIIVSSGSSVVTNGTLAQLTNGTVAVSSGSVNLSNAEIVAQSFIDQSDSYGAVNVNIASSSGEIGAIIRGTLGTTTIGTLTAGTTNGTLFASNLNRKYLLIQCTSGTAFIDTNGTATTDNGIQLTSGQGITFEGSFIPAGAITAITSTGTARLIGRQG